MRLAHDDGDAHLRLFHTARGVARQGKAPSLWREQFPAKPLGEGTVAHRRVHQSGVQRWGRRSKIRWGNRGARPLQAALFARWWDPGITRRSAGAPPIARKISTLGRDKPFVMTSMARIAGFATARLDGYREFPAGCNRPSTHPT